MITGRLVKGYSLGMELLCCLSPRPAWVGSLRRDFGFKHNQDVRDALVRVASDRALPVTFGRELRAEPGAFEPRFDGGYIWVDAEDWPRVERACLEYWESVYEGSQAA